MVPFLPLSLPEDEVGYNNLIFIRPLTISHHHISKHTDSWLICSVTQINSGNLNPPKSLTDLLKLGLSTCSFVVFLGPNLGFGSKLAGRKQTKFQSGAKFLVKSSMTFSLLGLHALEDMEKII